MAPTDSHAPGSDPAMPDAPATPGDAVDDFRMPLMEHLLEMRRRLVVVLAVVLVGMVVCFAFVQDIWDFLVAPMNDALTSTGRGTMAITEPLEGFLTYFKVALVAGIGLSSPVIFYQIWRFVAPGLYPREKRLVLPLVFFSTTLFLAGSSFGYFVIFRFAFPFFLQVTAEDVQAVLSINSYLLLATKLLLAFGVSFELPVVVFLLARMGLIDHKDMIHFFRYSMVAIFVVSAFLTPPDVVSQLLMAGPLLVLYVLSIGVAWLFSTKDRTHELTTT